MNTTNLEKVQKTAKAGLQKEDTIHKHEMQITHTHTHTHPFNGCFSRTTHVSQYQRGKTNLYFSEARDSEWQLHQLGHMQVCTSLQTDNHTSTPPLSFYRPDALPSIASRGKNQQAAAVLTATDRPTNSVKALKHDMEHQQQRPFNGL